MKPRTSGLAKPRNCSTRKCAWLLASGNPMNAQHYVGKMLKHIGTDRLLWGSECVWFGSPQRRIEAFRTFTISQEFQDMYGYPELTPAIKERPAIKTRREFMTLIRRRRALGELG